MRGGVNEASAYNLISDGISVTYIPNTGINSCINAFRYENFEPGGKYYIELVVTWSGFDTSNTAGSFDMWFQGAQRKTISEGYCWKYGNVIANALNGYMKLRDIVLSKASGSKKICGKFTIGEITAYDLGLRSDYSNGKGTLRLSNIKLLPLNHSLPYGDNVGMKIFDNEVLSQEIIEF